jgi:hypothetical protein
MLIFGRYVDRFNRRNGEWKIYRRVTVFDNPIMFDVPPNGAKMGPNWTVGKRDQSDTIYSLKNELNL